jgi:hypothetical protein
VSDLACLHWGENHNNLPCGKPLLYDPMPRKDLTLPPTKREAELMAEVERLRAVMPDQIEIYRLFRRAGMRKHAELAKIVADYLAALTEG